MQTAATSLFLAGILATPAALASTSFYAAPSLDDLTPGSEFEAAIAVNSDVPLNAYLLVLRYSPETLEVVRFNNSGSIINVWQNQPTASTDGVIRWSGGSFTPFSGEGGELLRIIFKTRATGAANISFETAEAYIADGKGTRAESNAGDLAFRIVPGEPRGTLAASDNAPPVIETLALASDPFNPNQNLLSFIVKDADSGVKDVEARYRTYLGWSEWQTARNPVAFPPNAWAVGIRVRDNVGNQTAQIVYHWPAFFKNFSPLLFAILAIFGLAAIAQRRKLSNTRS